MQLASPTLGKLLTNVRNMLNSPSSTNSFWSDAEIIEYINEAIRLHYQECALNNEGLYTVSTMLDITANSESVTLPTDFFEGRALYKQVTNGYMILPYQNSINENYITTGGTSQEAYIPSYFFQGNSIILRPVPNFSQSQGLKLDYIQFPDQLFNANDSLSAQISPVFKQLIERYAIYQAKLKESMVNGGNMHLIAKDSLDNIYQLFKEVVKNRSKYQQYVQPWNPEGSI